MKIDTQTQETIRDPAARRAWVIYQLKLRGLSLSDLARSAGVTRQCLYQVFNSAYLRMEHVIADALSMEPKDLWPERYHTDGSRVRGLLAKGKCNQGKSINNAKEGNVKMTEAG